MDQKEQIAQQSVIEDEQAIGLVEKIAEEKRIKRKTRTKRISWVCFSLFFVYAAWFLIKPFKASAKYGICRTMLELQLSYPQTLYVSEVKNKRGGAMEIWYTYVDAFGEYRMEPFICKVEQVSSTGFPVVTELRMNKISINPERLTFLNNAMPYFVENPYVLDYPAPLPDSLGDLQLEIESLRKYKINIRK